MTEGKKAPNLLKMADDIACYAIARGGDRKDGKTPYEDIYEFTLNLLKG